MTLIINCSNESKITELLRDALKKSNDKGNLLSHYGKLKRNIDDIEYQNEIRKNED